MFDTVNRDQVFNSTIEYLEAELNRHITDEFTAKGKVEEARELLNRLQMTCHLCGKYVPNYRAVDISTHIKLEHEEADIQD